MKIQARHAEAGADAARAHQRRAALAQVDARRAGRQRQVRRRSGAGRRGGPRAGYSSRKRQPFAAQVAHFLLDGGDLALAEVRLHLGDGTQVGDELVAEGEELVVEGAHVILERLHADFEQRQTLALLGFGLFDVVHLQRELGQALSVARAFGLDQLQAVVDAVDAAELGSQGVDLVFEAMHHLVEAVGALLLVVVLALQVGQSRAEARDVLVQAADGSLAAGLSRLRCLLLRLQRIDLDLHLGDRFEIAPIVLFEAADALLPGVDLALHLAEVLDVVVLVLARALGFGEDTALELLAAGAAAS